jgi:hypothetical protein
MTSMLFIPMMQCPYTYSQWNYKFSLPSVTSLSIKAPSVDTSSFASGLDCLVLWLNNVVRPGITNWSAMEAPPLHVSHIPSFLAPHVDSQPLFCLDNMPPDNAYMMGIHFTHHWCFSLEMASCLLSTVCPLFRHFSTQSIAQCFPKTDIELLSPCHWSHSSYLSCIPHSPVLPFLCTLPLTTFKSLSNWQNHLYHHYHSTIVPFSPYMPFKRTKTVFNTILHHLTALNILGPIPILMTAHTPHIWHTVSSVTRRLHVGLASTYVD